MKKWDKVLSFLAEECDVNQITINRETTFKDDLGLDSLDSLELLNEVEVKLGIELTDTISFETVGEFFDYISQLMNDEDYDDEDHDDKNTESTS